MICPAKKVGRMKASFSPGRHFPVANFLFVEARPNAEQIHSCKCNKVRPSSLHERHRRYYRRCHRRCQKTMGIKHSRSSRSAHESVEWLSLRWVPSSDLGRCIRKGRWRYRSRCRLEPLTTDISWPFFLFCLILVFLSYYVYV